MRFSLERSALIVAVLLHCSPVLALDQEFDLPKQGITFSTGDTWSIGNNSYRLFGVQACLRNTYFTNHAGQKIDCGTTSLSYLAAFVKDAPTRCRILDTFTANSANALPTSLVICSSRVGSNVVDLGTVLMTQGFAFAALTNDSTPVYMPYSVAEATARQNRKGLWAFADLPTPNKYLLNK